MSNAYKKLSREEWREIADATLKAEKTMHDLVNALSGKFPRKIALDNSLRIYHKIERLHSDLDTELGKQYKSNEMSREEFFSYFYPGN